MSSGIFRGKESSNRIELSRLVQDLLNFGVLGSLQLWGWGVDGWGWGLVGGAPTHVHMHAHACTNARTRTRVKHDNFMQMAAPIGGIPYDIIRMCACVCTCVGGTLSPPPESVKIQ